MNTLVPKITLAFAVAIGSISCQTENLVNPAQPSAAARQGADEIIPPISQVQVHKLITYGDVTLTYADDGRLRKVTTAPSRGHTDVHTDYTYGPGWVRAIRSDGAAVTRDETFTLDASGRCVESKEEGTVVYNNAPFQYTTYWQFSYNAKGQLWSCTNKNSCVGGTAYTYNADGDLILATVTTNAGGGGIGIKFTHSELVNAPGVVDKYPIQLSNPQIAEHDTYLPIFGKPGKHLIKRVSFQPSGNINYPAPSDRFYTYVLDADGYVTQRTMANALFGSPVEKTPYAYVVTNAKMQL